MLETLKNAIFGDPKEKQKRELEKIIKAKLEPVEAYLVINGNLWEHDYGRPYVRRLRDGYTATSLSTTAQNFQTVKYAKLYAVRLVLD